MDPISIIGLIGSVVSISEVVAKSIRKLSDLRSRYHHAPFQLSTLIGQLYIIQAAVDQLEKWKSSIVLDQSRYHELASQIEGSLDSFCPLILGLQQYLDDFDAAARRGSLHIQDRFQYVWNEKEIDVYLVLVDRQINALNLFLQAVQCNTWAEQKSKVGQQESQVILASARDCNTSILGLGDNRTGVASDNTNDLSVQFDFDAVVMGSRVYRNAHRSHLRQAIRASHSDLPLRTQEASLQKKPGEELVSIKEEPGEAFTAHVGGLGHDHRPKYYNLPEYYRLPSPSPPSDAVPSGERSNARNWLETTPWRSLRKTMRHRQADHAVKVAEAIQPKFDPKILVLGTSKSGKSTLLRLLTMLIEGEYTEEERAEWIDTILSCVVGGTLQILQALERDLIYLEKVQNLDHAETIFRQYGEIHSLLPEVEAAISSLWGDKGVLEAFHRSMNRLPANVKLLADQVQRLAQQGQSHYLPTMKDILLVHKKTLGIHEYPMCYNDQSFKLYDVGGTRPERKKWIHAFANVSGIIFTADVTSYCKVLWEDEETFQAQEELSLFDSVANTRWFINTRLVLVFTHVDKLDDTLTRYPVTDCFPDFESVHFLDSPQYQEDYLSYLRSRFLSLIVDEKKQESVEIFHANLIHADGIMMAKSILNTVL